MNCQTCNDPTKYIFALWDGPNGTHGRTYDCHNLDCELKLNMLRNAVITEQEKELVKEANEKNKIFMEKIKARRKELGITIMKMSQGLGISPSVYSDYEQYRNVVPLDIGDRIEGIFRKEENKIQINRGQGEISVILNPDKEGDSTLLRSLIETMRERGREALEE